MTIGVIGTCTGPGIGMALRQILNEEEVFAFEAEQVLQARAQDEVFDRLMRCDIVFSHFLPTNYGSLSTKILKDRHPSFHFIPSIAFTGFQPDCIYLTYNGRQYGSPTTPLNPYHSGIVAAAYSLGFGADQTERLFTAETFRLLGYYDEFRKARFFLERIFRDSGLDLNHVWSDWMARGSFMYTINHPKGFVVSDIARLLAIGQKLAPSSVPAPELAYDLLGFHTVWPVYPELAEPLGIKGNYLFKRPGAPDPVKGNSVFIGLRQMIEDSFAAYASYPKEAFINVDVARIAQALQGLLVNS